jgi:hypothetical protein
MRARIDDKYIIIEHLFQSQVTRSGKENPQAFSHQPAGVKISGFS